MTYNIEIHPKCKEEIHKLCRKNPVLENSLRNKIKEVLENPQRYKPLRHELAGERRVHIMKSFVLKYEINEENKTVIFSFFGHHDEAYRR